MRSRLARAVADAVARPSRRRESGTELPDREASAGPVEDTWFVAEGEPYPRHWRRTPRPWPSGRLGDRAFQILREETARLPQTWQQVLAEYTQLGADVAAGPVDATARSSDARAAPNDTATERHRLVVDLTEEQRRDITEHAVARLRRRLVERLTGRGEP